MFSATHALQEGHEYADLGLLELADSCFLSVWQCPFPYASPQHKLLALNGFCRVMDLRGQWYQSETRFADGFRQLTQPQFTKVTPFSALLPPGAAPGAFVMIGWAK